MFNANKPYKVRNKLAKKLETGNKTGSLDISVFSSGNQNPISDAEVTIYLYEVRGIYHEAATENEIVSYTTDENGKIPPIVLPVIHEFGAKNTAEYHVRVYKAGYYPVIVMNIEVFPNTTTSYNVILTPVTTGESHTEFIIIPEKH